MNNNYYNKLEAYLYILNHLNLKENSKEYFSFLNNLMYQFYNIIYLINSPEDVKKFKVYYLKTFKNNIFAMKFYNKYKRLILTYRDKENINRYISEINIEISKEENNTNDAYLRDLILNIENEYNNINEKTDIIKVNMLRKVIKNLICVYNSIKWKIPKTYNKLQEMLLNLTNILIEEEKRTK